MTFPPLRRRNSGLALAAPLLLLAGCGGNSSETPGSAPTSDVAAKAVADVDAAMADAQRSPVATPQTTTTPTTPAAAPAR